MLTPKTRIMFAGIAGILVTLAIVGFWILQDFIVIYICIAVVLLLSVQVLTYRKVSFITATVQNQYRQIQAMFSLFSLIDTTHPLPQMGESAIHPDLAVILIGYIKSRKPNLIIELGSGVSTLICAYALKQNGGGRIVSFDQNELFAEQTRQNLQDHRLSDFAEIVVAPLKTISVNDKSWDWYDVERIDDGLRNIDMLVIDGPFCMPGCRYPALPIFASRLAKNAVILLDDAKRPGEQQILKAWLAEFPEYSLTELETEKGTAILRRK